MVETLAITIDRHLKGKISQKGELNHRKNRMC
ncbi:unnamed protein product, partial [marine sediment metagenome]